MTYTNFDEFFEDYKNLSASELLAKARAKRYYLIIEKDAVVSRGGDGLSLSRSLESLTSLIRLLEQDVSRENGVGTIQIKIRNEL